MSGGSYTEECPKCGGQLECHFDIRPYESVSGECLECGFCYYTIEGQANLADLNERRADYDMPPLEALKPQRKEGKVEEKK